MSLDNPEKSGTRHKARECALQMLFAADVTGQSDCPALTASYWKELGDESIDDKTRQFANDLVCGTVENITNIDERIRTRAEHWRIERMAVVDRNVLRLAVFEFLYRDTPNTVAINEALETARRFSSYEATQFINGILDGIRQDIDSEGEKTKTHTNSV